RGRRRDDRRRAGGLLHANTSVTSGERAGDRGEGDEQAAPGYPRAAAIESGAFLIGDSNFPGVGLSDEDRAFLAARRAAEDAIPRPRRGRRAVATGIGGAAGEPGLGWGPGRTGQGAA